MSAEKLLDALRAGSATIHEADGVVSRALSEAMEGAVNDPQIHVAA